MCGKFMGDALSIRESEGIRAEEELTCVAVASKAPGTGTLELAVLGWFSSDVSNEARRKGLGLHTDLL